MLANNERQMKKFAIIQKIRPIYRLSLLLVVFLLIGITGFTLPATAATTQDKPVLVSPASQPTIPTPKRFNPEKVFLGITATGWSNADDPSIDLSPPTPYQQVLSEMALAGFKGTQMSGKFPQDIASLKSALELRNLTIVEN